MQNEPTLPQDIALTRRDVPLRLWWRALVELARARARHGSLPVAEIETLNAQWASAARGPAAAEPQDAPLVRLVAHAIPRVAWFLPWRSDCLPQAMAAQQWLGAEGVATAIVIGVDRERGGAFESHAWLQYGDQVVTGGNVARFQVVLGTQADGIQ